VVAVVAAAAVGGDEVVGLLVQERQALLLLLLHPDQDQEERLTRRSTLRPIARWCISSAAGLGLGWLRRRHRQQVVAQAEQRLLLLLLLLLRPVDRGVGDADREARRPKALLVPALLVVLPVVPGLGLVAGGALHVLVLAVREEERGL